MPRERPHFRSKEGGLPHDSDDAIDDLPPDMDPSFLPPEDQKKSDTGSSPSRGRKKRRRRSTVVEESIERPKGLPLPATNAASKHTDKSRKTLYEAESLQGLCSSADEAESPASIHQPQSQRPRPTHTHIRRRSENLKDETRRGRRMGSHRTSPLTSGGVTEGEECGSGSARSTSTSQHRRKRDSPPSRDPTKSRPYIEGEGEDGGGDSSAGTESVDTLRRRGSLPNNRGRYYDKDWVIELGEKGFGGPPRLMRDDEGGERRKGRKGAR